MTLYSVPPQRVVIVGAGFSGAGAAIQLLDRLMDNSDDYPFGVEVILAERDPARHCGGLAYGFNAAARHHKVNLHARRMSLFPDRPNDFMDWLDGNNAGIPVETRDSVPRLVYQRYIKDRLAEAAERAHGVISFDDSAYFSEVVDVIQNNGMAEVVFADGSSLEADHVVLATGYLDAVRPHFCRAVEHDPRVLMSQWGPEGCKFMNTVRESDSVFIIGTGMSAADAVISLQDKGHKGEIVMMSGHGNEHSIYVEGHIPGPLELPRPSFLYADTIEDLVNGVQTEWRKLQQQGHIGEQILGAWERYLPELVERFGVEQLLPLYREYKSLIDTQRISVSFAIGDAVEKAKQNGQLSKWSGEILSMDPLREGIRVNYEVKAADGSRHQSSRMYDRVISALGQKLDYTLAGSSSSLWNRLIARGLVRPHATGLGIDVNSSGAVIGDNGEVSNIVSAVGTMRAGDTMISSRRYGEKQGYGGRLGPPAIAVPGIRDQFPDLAEHISRRLEDNVDQHAEAFLGRVSKGAFVASSAPRPNQVINPDVSSRAPHLGCG